MITVTGRLVARFLFGAAGVVLAVTGIAAYRADRYTPAEVVTSAIAFLAALAAALWLRRDSRQHDGRRPR